MLRRDAALQPEPLSPQSRRGLPPTARGVSSCPVPEELHQGGVVAPAPGGPLVVSPSKCCGRFLKPAPLGHPLALEGWSQSGRHSYFIASQFKARSCPRS